MLSRIRSRLFTSSAESFRLSVGWAASSASSSPAATDCSCISLAHRGSCTVSMNTTSAASISAAITPK